MSEAKIEDLRSSGNLEELAGYARWLHGEYEHFKAQYYQLFDAQSQLIEDLRTDFVPKKVGRGLHVRQKMRNVFFTFLYPGRYPGSGQPDKDAPCIAIPDNGEFVSVCGERYGGDQPSAVFYDPQSLRDIADVLYEAAELFEDNQAKAKVRR